jgi:hypothetical protein
LCDGGFDLQQEWLKVIDVQDVGCLSVADL